MYFECELELWLCKLLVLKRQSSRRSIGRDEIERTLRALDTRRLSNIVTLGSRSCVEVKANLLNGFIGENRQECAPVRLP
jgi:hypothetical protein